MNPIEAIVEEPPSWQRVEVRRHMIVSGARKWTPSSPKK
jgi:hypothetical protein